MRIIVGKNGYTAVEKKGGKTLRSLGTTREDAIRQMQERLDPNRPHCLICGSPKDRCCC